PSTNYSDYTWSKFKGDQGIPGPPGKDGQPTYSWVKYADDEHGNGMSDSPEGKLYIGLAFNKTTPEESNNPADYTWSLMPQNIEIGGRNLIPNTSDNNKTVSWIGWDYPLLNVPHIEDIGLSVGDSLVFRLYIEETNAPVRACAQFTLNDGSGNRFRQKSGNIIYEGESGWSEVKFTISEEDIMDLQEFRVAIRNTNASNATVTYRKAKM